MPRGPVVYTLPPGTTPQQPNTPIPSATFNAAMDDIASTFNTATPDAYGGTGATSASNFADINNAGSVAGLLLKDIGGTVTAGGTATAVTATLNRAYSAYGASAGQLANGTLLALKMPSAATGAATLNISAPSALGAKAIRREGDTAIQANDWLANATVLLRYDTAYNSAAGAWVLLNADVSSYMLRSSVASAATLDLSSTARHVDVTGTATITAITLGDLQSRFLRAAGGWSITASATLIFNGQTSGTYSVVGNDAFLVEGYGASIVRVWLIGSGGGALPVQSGIWSPVFSSTGATFSYAVQEGTYRKIGGQVTVNFRLGLNTSGNTLTANPLGIGGFPFAISDSVIQHYQAIGFFAPTTAYVSMGVLYGGSGQTVSVVGLTGAGGNNLVALNSNAALSPTAGTVLFGTITYFCAV